MSKETPPGEGLRIAIEQLSEADLVRLVLIARTFDSHRHEDLIQEAISRTLSGERQWRDGIDLVWHLHETMRSIAWNWAKKRDENLVLDSQAGIDGDDGGHLARASSAAPDPERMASARLMLERIVESCGSDPVVLGLMKGKLEGKTGPEIREELHLNQRDFNAAAQRLRRSARALVGGRRYA